MGARVHLAHPLGNDWGNRRVKNDVRDANDLVDLLRLGRLAEAWVAPHETRELRELVRFRAKLVRLRSGLKAQVHAVMGKHGVLPARVDMFGPGGTAQLDALDLPAAYACRLTSLRELVGTYDAEVARLDRTIAKRLAHHRGYRAIQAIDGVGPVIAAVMVAEIGDVARFPSPDRLCSWAGLTPATASPISRSAVGRSPSRGRGCCDGRRSRRCRRTTCGGGSTTPTGASPSAAAATSPRSPRRADSSPSSTTGCATARSAASPARHGGDARTQPAATLGERHDPLRVVHM
jgi:hypothetical protein